MACEGCGRARAKLLAGYPGAAAAEAARVLWWKARRGRKATAVMYNDGWDQYRDEAGNPAFDGYDKSDANGRS